MSYRLVLSQTATSSVIDCVWDRGERLGREPYDPPKMFSIKRSGDGCISIDIPKKFLYQNEMEELSNALLMLVKDKEQAEETAKKRREFFNSSRRMIEHVDHPSPNDIEKLIAGGRGGAFFSSKEATRAAAMKHGCDAWYTERNGDPIGLLVPSGTKETQMPDFACGYITFGWLKIWSANETANPTSSELAQDGKND